VIVVDERYRLPIGRPFLTAAIDVCSRCVAGLVVTLEAPSATSVGLCLAHMVTGKRAWLERLGVEAAWPMSGKPRELHVDNAAEFKSEALRRGCDQHGIGLRYRPPGQPHFGGVIERLIGTMMQMVHELPGTTFSSTAERETYDSDGKAPDVRAGADMTAPPGAGTLRWPLHPCPGPAEALSSWLDRTARLYGLSAGDLLRHNLGSAFLALPGRDDLDLYWDPPREVLAALGGRTGMQLHELLPMTMAGWVPWLIDTLDPAAGQEMFDTYVRQHSVLLRPGETGRNQVSRWLPWVPSQSRRLSFCSRRCRAMESMVLSVTLAPPMLLPRLRADSCPSRVRSRMYSRPIPDRAASTVNTIPDGSCEPCNSPARNSRAISLAFTCSASAARSRPRPWRLCSWTTRVTATSAARSSRAKAG
jgi:transposase InsO family protein